MSPSKQSSTMAVMSALPVHGTIREPSRRASSSCVRTEGDRRSRREYGNVVFVARLVACLIGDQILKCAKLHARLKVPDHPHLVNKQERAARSSRAFLHNFLGTQPLAGSGL